MDFEVSRRHVVDACRTLMQRGYLKATEGNVSVRVPGRDAYAVTPSNYDYEAMRPEDVVVLTFDGDVLAGDMKASIEAGMHAGVYRLRPDVNAIVHTHQPFASALAVMHQPIPALGDEQARFLGRRVEIIDYAPSGTSFLAKNVAKTVSGSANAFILATHGVLVLGTSAQRAVFNMALLEKASIAYLMALTAGGKVRTVPAPIREVAVSKLRAEQARIAKQLTESVPPPHVPEGEEPSVDDVRVPAAEVRETPADDAREPAAATLASAIGAPESPRRDRVDSPEAEALGYAISRWPDTDEVLGRLDALVAQPPRTLRHDYELEVLDWFEKNASASKELTARARGVLPGGAQHNLAFNYPFPLAIDRAEGAYLHDRDGNRYIDFLQAGGPTILGSNYAPVREKVREVVETSGPVTGLFHEMELLLATEVQKYYPSVEMFRSLGSGTESVMAAVRGARAFTGKKWVIKVGGAYHGWSDTMVYGLRVPGTRRMNAKGIPGGATGATAELFPHRIGELKARMTALKALGGVAAVIVEPVGPESGTRPVPYDFNAQVRELCDEMGALLIFDEVVTGFRLGMGGAQGYFNVRPDLTVFGKAIAGGYPMAGAVGGRADVMATFGSGLDGKHGSHIQVGGTLSANPLSCAAGYFAIQEMARTNAPVIAGRAGDRLTAGLNRIIARYGLPYVAYNQGSIVHLETSGVMLLDMRHPVKLLKENKARKTLMEHMGAAYTANGIITLAGSRMYTSMADTDEVIDAALAGFDEVLRHVEGV